MREPQWGWTQKLLSVCCFFLFPLIINPFVNETLKWLSVYFVFYKNFGFSNLCSRIIVQYIVSNVHLMACCCPTKNYGIYVHVLSEGYLHYHLIIPWILFCRCICFTLFISTSIIFWIRDTLEALWCLLKLICALCLIN